MSKDARPADEAIVPNQRSISSITLHLQAQQRVQNLVHHYAEDVILQAKVYAYRRGDAELVSSDVDRASNSIFEGRVVSRWKELAKLMGSGTFGLGITGFISQLNSGNPTTVEEFVALAFVGLVAAFWGLTRG